jgi:beta-lactamase regulating signal transducer with metallopeptidase domain
MSEALSTPLSSLIPQAVGWALLHFIWQGALVAFGLRAALSLMRGRSSAARYGVAAGAMALLLVLPVATAFRSYAPEPDTAVSPDVGSAASLPSSVQGAPVSQSSSGPVPSAATVREILQPYLPALFAAWLAGVALVSLYHLGGWLQARRLTLRGTRPASEAWVMTFRRLRHRLGIERAVALLESSIVPVPAVVGWLRPVILVPASVFAGLTPEQLEAVLAHELAHVRRHDYLVNLVQAMVESLLFYHPAVWWVSRQVRQERECCCDDLAVAVCGDRLDYARALAVLEGMREGMRAPVPQLALGADGGSLLRRIRRIAGLPERNGAASPAWLAGLLAVAFLATGAIVQDGVRAAQGSKTSDDMPANHGEWTAERDQDGLQLTMTRRSGNGVSQHGHHYKLSDLTGLGPGPDVHFEMRRDAGTFRFDGRFDGSGPGSQGSGTFTFQGNPGYVRELAGLGYNAGENKLFSLALFDVSPGFIRDLRSLGYDELSLDDLVEFRIHGVSPEYIRSLESAGYPDLPADRLVEFRIHGVSPEEIRDLASVGIEGLTPDRLVEFRIHGVDAELVRALSAAGYENIPAEKLVELKIHGATPEFAHEMAELGYSSASLDKLVEFRIHGVSPGFIREIAATGHRDVAADDLVSMRIHGVSADFIRKAEARAGHALTIDKLIGLKIRGSDD